MRGPGLQGAGRRGLGRVLTREQADRLYAEAVAERDLYLAALRHLMEFGERLMASEVMEERGIGCCICEGARVALDREG